MFKKTLIEQINIKEPCSESWDEMSGNDEVRFCSHCSLNVTDLSAMTRQKALKIVKKAEGGICVRYVQNPVDKTPVFADKLYRITRRAGLAAGVLGVSMTLSTMTYAQGGTGTFDNRETPVKTSCDDSEKDKTESPSAEVSGTVTDSEGKFAAAVAVYLYDLKSGESFMAMSDDDGLYEFKNVRQGDYKITISDEKGNAEVGFLEVSGARQLRQDIALTMPVIAEVTIETLPENQQVIVGGAIAIVIDYENPLSKAVWDENEKRAKKLVIKGANVNVREKKHSNITPLFLAVGNGNLKIAEMLLNFGADVNAVDDEGKTSLMRLDEDANVELVRLLLKHGAKINAVDNYGNTPLISAVGDYADAEILQVLLENGADVNAQNKEGKTALMEAAYDDNFENVKTLILGGANVNLKNNDGETAFDLTSDEKIEKLLKIYGAVGGETTANDNQ